MTLGSEKTNIFGNNSDNQSIRTKFGRRAVHRSKGENSMYLRKICTKMNHYHAEMRTWPRTEPEVNWYDVISRASGTNVDGSQWLYEIFEPNLVYTPRETDNYYDRTCQLHLLWKFKM